MKIRLFQGLKDGVWYNSPSNYALCYEDAPVPDILSRFCEFVTKTDYEQYRVVYVDRGG